MNTALGDISEDVSKFCRDQLDKRADVRADYKELLQLTLISFGKQGGTIKFRKPGAMHHARWMSKALYALKMFIFRTEFHLTPFQKTAIRSMCIFIVRFYVKAWTCCPLALEAPYQDLNFMKAIYAFRDIDQEISSTVLRKFNGHLWYLSDETYPFSMKKFHSK